jgi:hypothetical protein
MPILLRRRFDPDNLGEAKQAETHGADEDPSVKFSLIPSSLRYGLKLGGLYPLL